MNTYSEGETKMLTMKTMTCVSPTMLAALVFAYTEGTVCAGAHAYLQGFGELSPRAHDLKLLVGLGYLTRTWRGSFGCAVEYSLTNAGAELARKEYESTSTGVPS